MSPGWEEEEESPDLRAFRELARPPEERAPAEQEPAPQYAMPQVQPYQPYQVRQVQPYQPYQPYMPPGVWRFR